jgi:glycerate kinase
MAYALGWRFMGAQGNAFCPVGGTLADIAQIIPPETPFPLPVIAACDVTNPLCGENGAAYVYAPQKGADAAMVRRLDAGLNSVARLMPEGLSPTPGAGAAGGTGFGVMAFLGGELQPGIDLLLDQSRFGDLLAGADLVITGEGRMDAQTLQGKAPFGVLQRALVAGVPAIAICGCLGEGAQALLNAGFAALYPAVTRPKPFDELLRSCREDLYNAAVKAAQETKMNTL